MSFNSVDYNLNTWLLINGVKLLFKFLVSKIDPSTLYCGNETTPILKIFFCLFLGAIYVAPMKTEVKSEGMELYSNLFHFICYIFHVRALFLLI